MGTITENKQEMNEQINLANHLKLFTDINEETFENMYASTPDNEFKISNTMAQTLDDYLFRGFTPGSFATALLTNDLYGAVRSADFVNIQIIPDLVKLLTALMPTMAYGTEQKYTDWITDKDNRRTKYVNKMAQHQMWRTLNDSTTK